MCAIVYVGRTYTAAVASKKTRNARCEKCRCAFAYVMLRRATGRAHSPYMLNNQGASDAATRRAEERLEAQNHSSDPVPCPDCGWFNADAVDAAKHKSWKWSPWGQGRGVDPNEGYPQNRGRFPGMPTPVRIAPGTRPGKPPRHLFAPQEEPGGHITIHPQRDRLPDTCCACLEPTSERALIQFTRMRIPPLDYPICQACGRRYSRLGAIAAWSTFALSILLVSAIFYPFVARGFRHDPDVAVIVAGGLGLCLGLIAGAFILIFIRPFMPFPIYLSAYDDARNLYRIRFANPAFIELAQKSIAAKPLPAIGSNAPSPSDAAPPDADDNTIPLA